MTYSGNWIEGISDEYKCEVLGIEQGWIYMEETKDSDKIAIEEETKQRKIDDALTYKRDNMTT